MTRSTITNMDEVDLITITKAEYDSLVEDANWLRCLESAGVDNWTGYDHAQEILAEDEPLDEDN
jgi:hypothetical protein